MNIKKISTRPAGQRTLPAQTAGFGFGRKYRSTSKAFAFAAVFLASNPVFAVGVAPDLGAAFDYLVLGLDSSPTVGTVTCTSSTIDGNVGSSFTSITNTGCSITGTTDAPVSGTVITDFNNAYSALNTDNPTCDGTIPTADTTLAPGVYCSNADTTIDAGVTITLDGDASDVWVFKAGTSGTGAFTATGLQVVMGGTAQACNVYWWSAEGVTLTSTNFNGSVLAGGAFTMTGGGFDGRALARTEATVTDLASMNFAACAAPATITVNKDFSNNSAATVPVDLACTSGTITSTPLSASEGAAAVFTVGAADFGATCTATETVPLGYTADQTDCMGVALDGSCTITNTLNSDTVVVNKDFSPNSVASVPVALTCTSGSVTATPLNAAEGAPAVFTVTGALPGTACTATETVPDGYTTNQNDCMGVALGDSCTITNTLNSDTVVVNKDFSPNSPASVPVDLTCTSGNVTATPLNAAEGAPAVFTVTGALPGATCTATETVPIGYIANQTDCAGVALGESCIITNTLNSDTIVVNKDFSPNSVASVPVALTCTSGNITATPLDAAEGAPAVFTVTGALPGTTCTATETPPLGYIANQTDCAGVVLGDSCTITNTLNSNTIVVNKDFIPNSVASVPVALTCTSGSVTATPLQASESIPAVFTVTGALPGTTCTATETVPLGYAANQTDCVDVALGGNCRITNTLNSDTIVVNKDFSPNSPASVPVDLTCTSGTITATPLNAAEGAPAVFTVTGTLPGATCTATETVPNDYIANQTDCAGVALGESCTITNTLNSNRITVNKDFSPNSPASVPVDLTCTSGSVTATPLNASEGAAAVFTVTGADPGTTCTATETAPVGYTADQANCVGVALGGSCTITNQLNSNTIVVNKDFIPNSVAPVPVTLTCTSGNVTATPLNAVESAAAVFTVTGALPGTTCTATETVPIGYIANQTDCLEVALGESCTITNTLNSNTIAVNKDFIPNSVASVPVALTCTSGNVTATPLNAAEGAAAVFTVTGADPGTTCTATETAPVGYTADQANCVGVALGESCTITNQLDSNTIVVNKDFIPNSVAPAPVSLTCSSGTVSVTPLNASEAAGAVFTVTGALPGATCSATETVPPGYTANQTDCLEVALGESCTITNTLSTATITVNKDFSDNSAATVPVDLACTSGTITATPLNAAEGAPAVFTVTDANPGTTCEATETVPEGYTANQANCARVALNGNCTITNSRSTQPVMIPTISEWGMLLLGALLMLTGLAAARRQEDR